LHIVQKMERLLAMIAFLALSQQCKAQNIVLLGSCSFVLFPLSALL